jgi:sec-independent protein translocase protein TatB
MFGIDSGELLIIAVVALVVIGPKDLPRVMRGIGNFVGKARGMARHFRSGVDNMIRESELADMEKKWRADNERIMREHPLLPTPAEPEGKAAPEGKPAPAGKESWPAKDDWFGTDAAPMGEPWPEPKDLPPPPRRAPRANDNRPKPPPRRPQVAAGNGAAPPGPKQAPAAPAGDEDA